MSTEALIKSENTKVTHVQLSGTGLPRTREALGLTSSARTYTHTHQQVWKVIKNGKWTFPLIPYTVLLNDRVNSSSRVCLKVPSGLH